MERSDGKDPFLMATYYAPSGFNITTMVELRAFCAGFFELIRTKAATQEQLNKFLTLITVSSTLFARARAVIPELQVTEDVTTHPNSNTERVLIATKPFRGTPATTWGSLPDDPVWSQLADDGLKQIAMGTNKENAPVSASTVASSMPPI